MTSHELADLTHMRALLIYLSAYNALVCLCCTTRTCSSQDEVSLHGQIGRGVEPPHLAKRAFAHRAQEVKVPQVDRTIKVDDLGQRYREEENERSFYVTLERCRSRSHLGTTAERSHADGSHTRWCNLRTDKA